MSLSDGLFLMQAAFRALPHHPSTGTSEGHSRASLPKLMAGELV
eukprot:CAMPEP_0183435888 /NCGR_PEP_ID=MMETSP0370-20130417/68902_1 /TAXON_ID=268820 /ORGANISM="Peridinium aciculiferum, Strain PAER-2" /LENGTH=43 /DNA_ID= /DNA_START= /DNA_END= /DNA_ORIENTATION=